MLKFDDTSRCCSNTPIIFRWYGDPSAEYGEDLIVATKKFLAVIQNHDRLWNEHIQSMARAEFRNRIMRASQGKLRDIVQIKPVDIRNPPPLYEFRWQTITILESDGEGGHQQRNVHVRMYHSEPTEAPGHFVGHHIHEKIISDNKLTNSLQDAEIEIAKAFYETGKSARWGIPNLPIQEHDINYNL